MMLIASHPIAHGATVEVNQVSHDNFSVTVVTAANRRFSADYAPYYRDVTLARAEMNRIAAANASNIAQPLIFIG